LEQDVRKPGTFGSSIEEIVREFNGALAISVAREEVEPTELITSLNILVPTTGTDYSRVAAEVGIAIAKAANCPLTALNVSPPADEALFARRGQKHLRPGRAVLKDIKELGRREGVSVKAVVAVRRTPEPAILSQIRKGKHQSPGAWRERASR